MDSGDKYGPRGSDRNRPHVALMATWPSEHFAFIEQNENRKFFFVCNRIELLLRNATCIQTGRTLADHLSHLEPESAVG